MAPACSDVSLRTLALFFNCLLHCRRVVSAMVSSMRPISDGATSSSVDSTSSESSEESSDTESDAQPVTKPTKTPPRRPRIAKPKPAKVTSFTICAFVDTSSVACWRVYRRLVKNLTQHIDLVSTCLEEYPRGLEIFS